MSDSISRLREKIDRIDDEIFALLEKRMEYAKNIGTIKILQNSAVRVPEREKSILSRLQQKDAKFLTPYAIQTIYQEIFSVSRSLELSEKTAFLGSIGDFAHQAVELRFGMIDNCMPVDHTSSVFDALKSQRVKYGLIPLENQDGIIGESIELLLQNDFKIIAEVFLPMHYYFIGNIKKLQEVEKIYSKECVFNQCEMFLQSYGLAKIKKISVDSFIEAGYLASKERNVAVICPKVVARLCELPILFENIEDSCESKRFAVIGDFFGQATGKDKTSIFVLQEKNQSELLSEILMDFSKHKINITTIASKNIDTDSKNGFYIDFDGHYNDNKIQKLLQQRQKEIKWLGSYIKEK